MERFGKQIFNFRREVWIRVLLLRKLMYRGIWSGSKNLGWRRRSRRISEGFDLLLQYFDLFLGFQTSVALATILTLLRLELLPECLNFRNIREKEFEDSVLKR